MKYPIQVTRATQASVPVESLLRDGGLKDILIAMHAHLKEGAMRRIHQIKTEASGSEDWAVMPDVRTVSQSHDSFVFAGVAVCSMIATFEEC